MATDITKTVGTSSRDYSDIQSALDDLPASLVTADERWIFDLYADSEFTPAGKLDDGGPTTDSTRYVWVRAASGESFRDNASVQTNALKYNASNGVAVRQTANFVATFDFSSNFARISGVQAQTKVGASGVNSHAINTENDALVENCLGHADGTGAAIQLRDACVARNTIGIMTGGSGFPFRYPGSVGFTVEYYNCTAVAPSDNTTDESGFHSLNSSGTSSATIKNCVSCGCTGGFTNDPTNCTGNNNATDDTSVGFGTSNQDGITYADQFEDVTDSAYDFRVKSGADLIDVGATLSTEIPDEDDIAATARPSGSSWDIGCWEFVQAGGGFIPYPHPRGLNAGMLDMSGGLQ